MKILMVCIGNICRSPIAEGVLQQKVDRQKLDWQVDSAAVKSYHIGSSPHPDSIRICSEHGLDISDQRAMLFEEKHLREYDLIYVMAEDVLAIIREKIGEDHPEFSKVKYFLSVDAQQKDMNLLDPWYGGYEGYQEVYRTIDHITDQIIDQLS